MHVYIIFIGLAFITGVSTFTKKTPRYVAIIIFVMAADLVLEVCANYFLKFLHQENNNAIYSVAMLIEFWLYPLYYRYVLVSNPVKWIITGYLIVFPWLWFFLAFIISDISTWNSYISITGTVVLIALSACMYYQLFTANILIKLVTNFEFLLASAIIIYFSCSYTILGMLNHVIITNFNLAKKLLTILHILNVIYYGIIVYAFFARKSIQKE